MKIGDKELALSNFDTIKIIVTRYVLEKAKDDKYLTYRYVKVDLLDPVSQKNIKPILLTDLLRDIEFEDIAQAYTSEFPNISIREATILWAVVNGINAERLKELDSVSFSRMAETKIDLLDLEKNVDIANTKLSEKLERFDANVSKFESLKSSKSSPLIIESITTRFTLKNRYIAQELFDNIVVNEQNPICRLGAGDDSLFRVYTNMNLVELFPVKEGFVPPDGEVMFRVLGYKAKAHSLNYIDVIHTQDADILSIHRAISELGVDIAERRQISINATFTMSAKEFNRAIFSDLITTDNLLGYFLYLSEFRMPELLKNRFTVLFEPLPFRTTVRTMSPSFTILPTKTRDEIIVRVMNAVSLYEGEMVRSAVGKAISLYEKEKDKIKEIYISITPKTLITSFNFKYPISQSNKHKKEGRRLVQLKSRYPYTFREGYAQMCQPQRRQPFILEDKDVDAYVKKYGANKVLKYEDAETGDTVNYACEPREPGEDGNYNFIGLGNNKSKDLEYREEVPYIPCCFLQDQYSKKSSVINTKISTIIEADYVQEGREPTMGYVLDPSKSVPRARFGRLPEYLEELAVIAGYTDDKIPFYRYGVMATPDSLLHCTLRAFDEKYIFSEKETREEAVRELRSKLANQLLTPIAQQTFDMSNAEIREILKDEEAYIDPDIFLNLVARHFDCNIYLFEVDKRRPKGEIVILRSRGALLPTTVSDNHKSIVIVKNRLKGTAYPYQCSLVVKKTRGSMKFITQFEDEALVSEISKVVNSHLEVRSLTGNSFKTVTSITPSSLGNPKAQYIDSRGKTRALFYKNNVCLFTPPLAPFDIPRKSSITPCDIEAAKKLSARLNLHIVSQEISNNKAVGLWFEEGSRRLNSLYYAYIPILSVKPIKKVAISSPMLHDPLRTTSVSKLQEYREGRKIAALLVRWAIELYVSQSEEFGESSFRVDGSLKGFDAYYSRYLEGDTIVPCPSKEIIRRVRMRVRVAILNNTISDTFDFRRYGDTEDFSYQKNTTIVRGLRGLEILMLQNELYRQRWFITSEANITTTLPYILHHPSISRNPVIMQNVSEGDLGAAINVARGWMTYKKNTGYDTETVNPKKYAYKVLSLDEPGQSPSGELKLLRYENGNYAAILEMVH